MPSVNRSIEPSSSSSSSFSSSSSPSFRPVVRLLPLSTHAHQETEKETQRETERERGLEGDPLLPCRQQRTFMSGNEQLDAPKQVVMSVRQREGQEEEEGVEVEEEEEKEKEKEKVQWTWTWTTRRVVIALLWCCLVLLVFHQSLFGTFFTGASSQVTTQAAAAVQSFVAFHDPLALGRASFVFPKHSEAIYVSSWPDPIQPCDVQLKQWITGAYISLSYNLSYAYTPLLRHCARYSKWLGFGYGEDSEDDLWATFSRLRFFQRNPDDEKGIGAMELEAWVENRRDVARAVAQQTLDAHVRALDRLAKSSPPNNELDEAEAIVSLPIIEPKNSRVEGSALRHADGTSYLTTASVLRLFHVPISSVKRVCVPSLRRLLRQKYCAARVRMPLRQSLYDNDRTNNKLIVAFDAACGSFCSDPLQATDVNSIVRTIASMDALRKARRLPAAAFHIFLTPPSHLTLREWVAPLFEDEHLKNSLIRVHDSIHPHSYLHHLITSDVLLYNPHNPTLWLAAVLSDGIVAVDEFTEAGCDNVVSSYSRGKGSIVFDDMAQVYWRWSKNHTLPSSQFSHFYSLQDCFQIGSRWIER